MGLSPDNPQADFYTDDCALRYADGPGEAHPQTIARLELKESAYRRLEIAQYMAPRQ